MKNIKNILKTFLLMSIMFLVLSLLITFFNYFNIINYRIINIIKIIIPIITMLFGGFKIGKIAIKNGWLEGIKLSSLTNCILICITIFFKGIKLQYFLYLSILIFACILGSMFGINKKNT